MSPSCSPKWENESIRLGLVFRPYLKRPLTVLCWVLGAISKFAVVKFKWAKDPMYVWFSRLLCNLAHFMRAGKRFLFAKKACCCEYKLLTILVFYETMPVLKWLLIKKDKYHHTILIYNCSYLLTYIISDWKTISCGAKIMFITGLIFLHQFLWIFIDKPLPGYAWGLFGRESL